ncbi:hypothetical protein GQ53DRAFT_410198 [Thozetella sp. PMI_491]|nr:hypothetical protein GQ53DRAFT_410198 [Thozetella sp. PMI_491]
MRRKLTGPQQRGNDLSCFFFFFFFLPISLSALVGRTGCTTSVSAHLPLYATGRCSSVLTRRTPRPDRAAGVCGQQHATSSSRVPQRTTARVEPGLEYAFDVICCVQQYVQAQNRPVQPVPLRPINPLIHTCPHPG